MEIPSYDALVYYATPPNSYIGTTIFLSYIVAALYATIAIIYSLYAQYTVIFHTSSSSNDEKLGAAKAARARHIKVYAFLASISFATLSYHMLMFLITHYLEWSEDQSRSFSNVSVEKLKTWMLESTLFQDFAQDLVKDAPNAVWTQAAILATWFWNIYMGQKGMHSTNHLKVSMLTCNQREHADTIPQRCARTFYSVRSYPFPSRSHFSLSSCIFHHRM